MKDTHKFEIYCKYFSYVKETIIRKLCFIEILFQKKKYMYFTTDQAFKNANVFSTPYQKKRIYVQSFLDGRDFASFLKIKISIKSFHPFYK